MTKQKKTLTHLDEGGRLRMVDVGAKQITSREAVATGIVRMSSDTLSLVLAGRMPKGDVFTTAKVAGILAAKQTSQLVPLTHPLPLDFIDIEFDTAGRGGAISIRSTVRCQGRTGAEIEAMTACAVAALTIYDMCKSAEHGITIETIRLERKSGGKSGVYQRK